MPDETEPSPLQFQVELPSDIETGVFADFANIWHTPNTFILDFLSVKGPPTQSEEGGPTTVSVKVATRVRIPPEQIFPLIEALNTQGQQWLSETGRSKPSENWAP
jgi:hypothetical protein